MVQVVLNVRRIRIIKTVSVVLKGAGLQVAPQPRTEPAYQIWTLSDGNEWRSDVEEKSLDRDGPGAKTGILSVK